MSCCYWCDRFTEELTLVIVNATQEEQLVCISCIAEYGDEATGELNTIYDAVLDRKSVV